MTSYRKYNHRNETWKRKQNWFDKTYVFKCLVISSVLQGELLSPCRCSGSVRCTHHPCLIKWISERGSWACELCYYKYQVIAISTKNPLQVSCEKTSEIQAQKRQIRSRTSELYVENMEIGL